MVVFEEKKVITQACEVRAGMIKPENNVELSNELKRINKIIATEAYKLGNVCVAVLIKHHLTFPIKMILEQNGYYTEIYKDCLCISWSQDKETQIHARSDVNKYLS
jgi:hypothetical protein